MLLYRAKCLRWALKHDDKPVNPVSFADDTSISSEIRISKKLLRASRLLQLTNHSDGLFNQSKTVVLVFNQTLICEINNL